MTRYIEAFTWTGSIQRFLNEVVRERPLLNVCSGATLWGNVTMDRYEPADVRGSWTALPFADESFAAVFADPPWGAGYKTEVARFLSEATRVAPVAYLMAPWLYGAAWLKTDRVWVRQLPGVNATVSVTRYVRAKKAPAIAGSAGWNGHGWDASERAAARKRAVERSKGVPAGAISSYAEAP